MCLSHIGVFFKDQPGDRLARATGSARLCPAVTELEGVSVQPIPTGHLILLKEGPELEAPSAWPRVLRPALPAV